MHPLSCYLLRLWVCCRSSYSCWFVNCLSPTRCHLSAVPQSPSHVGRSAWRLPTSLTCSNRPHLRHTPPDPSGINSFSLHSCAAIAASQSVLCCGEGQRRGGGGSTEGMLGRNNETMREKAGRKVHDNGCAVQTAAARRAIARPCMINKAAEQPKTGRIAWVCHSVHDNSQFKRHSDRQGRSPSPGPDAGAAAC